jgi:hypothetical protein
MMSLQILKELRHVMEGGVWGCANYCAMWLVYRNKASLFSPWLWWKQGGLLLQSKPWPFPHG